jgi:signal transduction histidine kinase
MEIDYQALFEKSPGLFLVLDPELKIVTVTDAYLAATMTSRESIVSKNIFDVFPDNPNDADADGVNKLKISLQNVISLKVPDNMPIQKYDIKKSEHEFEERYWSPYNLPILDKAGNVTLIIHSVEDVTSIIQSRRLETLQKDENISLNNQNKLKSQEIYEHIRQKDEVNLELKRTNAVLEEKTRLLELSNEDLALFAETAAHDIKAPFRSIGGHLEIIFKKVKNLNDESINQSIESIRKGRERISLLLDDLLTFARVSRSAEGAVKIDLNKLLQEVTANLEYSITEKKAQIRYPHNMPVITGTYFQVLQLFQNLIGNALKFCEDVPVIEVSFADTGTQIEFAIKDNGIGIEKDYFEKIFDPFQRLHGVDAYAGTGLGLAICKRIVDQHGGSIRVSSDKNGTTFYFSLPL